MFTVFLNPALDDSTQLLDLRFLKPANSKYYAEATAVAQQAAMGTELSLEMQSFQKKGIGISDGRFAFDTYQVAQI